ncbi:MAG TPA: hypothetical protein P5560_10005 [Thermotogota bacterium]|nr:hypothetical protein [Thermotogota bacterium]HRW93268.1 hypothetical protein [Thermotogota bacterium]
MKKKLVFLALVVFAFFFVSCSTTIGWPFYGGWGLTFDWGVFWEGFLDAPRSDMPALTFLVGPDGTINDNIEIDGINYPINGEVSEDGTARFTFAGRTFVGQAVSSELMEGTIVELSGEWSAVRQ